MSYTLGFHKYGTRISYCLDFALTGGKVVSFLLALEREFIGKPDVAIF